MALDITWNNVIRTRTRLLAGSAPDEVDIDTLDITLDMAAEWFQDQTGITMRILMIMQ